MKKLLILSIAALWLLPVSAVCQSISADAEKGRVLKVVELWWTAWEKDSLLLLDQLADERFVEYFGGTKRTQGREALLSIARNIFPAQVLLEWKLDSPVVEIHRDAAVCNYFFRERYRRGSEEKSGSGCFTFFLVKKQGDWKVVASHGTNF